MIKSSAKSLNSESKSSRVLFKNPWLQSNRTKGHRAFESIESRQEQPSLSQKKLKAPAEILLKHLFLARLKAINEGENLMKSV